jgi:hypothetical protein
VVLQQAKTRKFTTKTGFLAKALRCVGVSFTLLKLSVMKKLLTVMLLYCAAA